jgi:adenylate cyclase
MSYSILIGAEIDKLLAIGMVTAILAVAQIRARQVLLASVSEKLASADLSRFLAPDVASRIRGGDGSIMAGQGELRSAAILFVDLRGFTPFASAMPPHEVTVFLAEYHARIVPLIEAHGGSIDKFLGDGILASFGAASDSASYAADALRAVEDILGEDERWLEETGNTRERPRIGASVAVGEVVFGAIGYANRLEYTVIGEVVNYAAKLEKHSKKENARAVVSHDAMKLAIDQGHEPLLSFDRRANRQIDGVSCPHDVFVVSR